MKRILSNITKMIYIQWNTIKIFDIVECIHYIKEKRICTSVIRLKLHWTIVYILSVRWRKNFDGKVFKFLERNCGQV